MAGIFQSNMQTGIIVLAVVLLIIVCLALFFTHKQVRDMGMMVVKNRHDVQALQTILGEAGLGVMGMRDHQQYDDNNMCQEIQDMKEPEPQVVDEVKTERVVRATLPKDVNQGAPQVRDVQPGMYGGVPFNEVEKPVDDNIIPPEDVNIIPPEDVEIEAPVDIVDKSPAPPVDKNEDLETSDESDESSDESSSDEDENDD